MKNQKTYLFLSILTILIFFFYLQDASASTSISEEWHKTWGEGLRDQCRAVAIDSSENIILAGHSEYDLLLLIGVALTVSIFLFRRHYKSLKKTI